MACSSAVITSSTLHIESTFTYSETLSVARLLGLSLLHLATRFPTTPRRNVITLIAAQQRASLKLLTSTAKTARQSSIPSFQLLHSISDRYSEQCNRDAPWPKTSPPQVDRTPPSNPQPQPPPTPSLKPAQTAASTPYLAILATGDDHYPSTQYYLTHGLLASIIHKQLPIAHLLLLSRGATITQSITMATVS